MSYQPAPGMQDEPGRGAPAVTKPQSVGLAEKLMYGGAAITLINALWGAFGDQDMMRDQVRTELERAGQAADPASVDSAVQIGVIAALVFGVLMAALWALMGWLNGRGVGWARIVATILGVLGVLSTVSGLVGAGLLPGAGVSAVSMVLSVVIGLIALAVVVLLWRPDAREFFASRVRR